MVGTPEVVSVQEQEPVLELVEEVVPQEPEQRARMRVVVVQREEVDRPGVALFPRATRSRPAIPHSGAHRPVPLR